jgi:hypothetical protein
MIVKNRLAMNCAMIFAMCVSLSGCGGDTVKVDAKSVSDAIQNQRFTFKQADLYQMPDNVFAEINTAKSECTKIKGAFREITSIENASFNSITTSELKVEADKQKAILSDEYKKHNAAWQAEMGEQQTKNEKNLALAESNYKEAQQALKQSAIVATNLPTKVRDLQIDVERAQAEVDKFKRIIEQTSNERDKEVYIKRRSNNAVIQANRALNEGMEKFLLAQANHIKHTGDIALGADIVIDKSMSHSALVYIVNNGKKDLSISTSFDAAKLALLKDPTVQFSRHSRKLMERVSKDSKSLVTILMDKKLLY